MTLTLELLAAAEAFGSFQHERREVNWVIKDRLPLRCRSLPKQTLR